MALCPRLDEGLVAAELFWVLEVLGLAAELADARLAFGEDRPLMAWPGRADFVARLENLAATFATPLAGQVARRGSRSFDRASPGPARAGLSGLALRFSLRRNPRGPRLRFRRRGKAAVTGKGSRISRTRPRTFTRRISLPKRSASSRLALSSPMPELSIRLTSERFSRIFFQSLAITILIASFSISSPVPATRRPLRSTMITSPASRTSTSMELTRREWVDRSPEEG